MGFVRDVAGAAISPLGAAMGLFNKKKPAPPTSIPMMINSPATRSPSSMIGPARGGGY